MIEVLSKAKKKISKQELKEICLLKDQHWKYGLKSQMNWISKNVKKNDICNILRFKKKIIGLTLLRKRTYFANKKKLKYFLFDTLIIDKNYRGKNFSELLMILNTHVILKSNLISLLFCNNNLLKFYIKFGWLKIKNDFSTKDYNFKTNAHIFNKTIFEKIKNRFLIFIQKVK